MASIINATTTTGVAISADNSGILQLATNSGTTAVTIDASQNVGVGTASPNIQTRLAITYTNKITDARGIVSINSTDAVATNLGGSLSLGGQTGQATAEYVFGSIAGRYEGSGYSGYLQFATTASNSVITERMRIDSSGNVLVTNPAGLGYGTGSGGTVTQATSKSTTVTLNKPTGQITMNNAALTGLTSVGFTFNNSLMVNTDILIVSISNATAANSYTTVVNWTGAGQAVIQLTNITAGSLSNAVVINFAIIKGATA